MDEHKILAEAKAELERHVWGTFIEGKASVALGGTGVVVSGCEACRKRFGTNSQYLRHLSEDVLPIYFAKGFRDCRRFDGIDVRSFRASTEHFLPIRVVDYINTKNIATVEAWTASDTPVLQRIFLRREALMVAESRHLKKINESLSVG